MKIILAGGSGQIGYQLAKQFQKEGHDVVVLSRRALNLPWRVVFWDGLTLGKWKYEIDGADVVINLAGRSVNCRYSAENRHKIIQSRTQSTTLIGQAIAQAKQPPQVWLQASTATIYAHTYGPAHDENGQIGGGEANVPETWRFSINVATAWEHAFKAANTPSTRKVLLRSAMVMDPEPNGVFATLSGLVKARLGGRVGDGKQFVSWIHYEDFGRIITYLIKNKSLEGVFNVASPNPLPNADFMRALRQARGIRLGLPATKWMAEIGAFFMRTETELVLKSRRVVPGRLLKAGFEFHHPHWETAAKNLVAQRVALGG